MIIQCEQCRTKFRLDDSKIRENGVKVRCAKCRHVFTVLKEQPAIAPQPEFGELLDQTPPFAEAAPPQEPQESPVREGEGAVPQPEFGDLLDRTPSFAEATPSIPEPESPFASLPPRGAAGPETEFGPFEAPRDEPFSFEPTVTPFRMEPQGTVKPEEPSTPAAPSLAGDEFDFGTVDFGPPEEPVKPADVVIPAPFPEEAAAPPQTARTDVDSGFGDLFEGTTNRDLSMPPPETTQGEPSPPATGPEMDFGDIFAPPTPTQPEQGAEPGGVREFVFEAPEAPPVTTPPADEILTPVKPAAAREQPAPPVITPREREAAPLSFGPAGAEPEQPPPAFGEELPPLSIPSRRKRSSLLKVLVPLLLVALIGAAAFYGKDLYLKYWPKPAEESGSIVLHAISSTFVKNVHSGNELLVISGEAVNGYTIPRAALQVKGMVYDDKDQVLVSKSAYCGNPLSKEQLAGMPLDAIEAAMANQLGSGLTNLEVAPGKAIPFTVVITTPIPPGARNFGVEPAGSQPVDQKSK